MKSFANELEKLGRELQKQTDQWQTARAHLAQLDGSFDVPRHVLEELESVFDVQPATTVYTPRGLRA